MLVDGRTIADDICASIKEAIARSGVRPHLTVLTCAPNFETQKFLALKREKANALGIRVNIIEFSDSVATAEVVSSLPAIASATDGIVVQLPFPPSIRIDEVLTRIPATLDVDAVNHELGRGGIFPPVVGAIDEIAKRHEVSFSGKRVVVVGNGRLVGRPAAAYARSHGAHVVVLTKDSPDILETLRTADILILGAGSPRLVLPEHVKDGVVIFDAGTSEDAGMLRGDADPACAEKAALMTPVPGGIGPITIAVLLLNLTRLAMLRHGKAEPTIGQ